MNLGEKFFNNCITFLSAEEMRQITSPLKLLGITYFGYHIFYKDGSHIRLNNNPNFMQCYYKDKLYQHSFFSRNPYPDGIILGSWLNNREPVYKAMEAFNIAPPLTIIENHTNFHICIHLGGEIKKPISSTYLLSNLALLYRFIIYFRQKAHMLIEQAKNQRFKIESATTTLKNSTTDTISHDAWKAFIKKTETKRIYINQILENPYLTRRELDVINLLKRGKKILEITEQLGISYKTMEKHSENIKKKLNCKSLFELGFKLGNLSWLSQSDIV